MIPSWNFVRHYVFFHHKSADSFFYVQKFLLFYSHKITLFFIIVKTVLQTDFFRNKFRRTNNLFGPPPRVLRYFSKDKRKTLWGHNDCYCYRGGVVLPSRGGQIPGQGGKGKMKLRLVKFLTSRENEIEKKEEGEGEALSSRVLPLPSQAAARAHAPAPLLFSPPPSFRSPSLHPAHQPASRRAQLVGRHVSGEQYSPANPPPAILLLPSFFIKLPKQKSVAVVTWRSTQLADPASRPSCSGRPARLPARASWWSTCPPSPPLSPVSRCGPSTSSEAIGKQRPKMNYPVSSPSLMDK